MVQALVLAAEFEFFLAALVTASLFDGDDWAATNAGRNKTLAKAACKTFDRRAR
jgi:hypothetical protein